MRRKHYYHKNNSWRKKYPDIRRDDITIDQYERIIQIQDRIGIVFHGTTRLDAYRYIKKYTTGAVESFRK